IIACSKKSNPPANNPPVVTPPVTVTPIISLPAGWKMTTGFMTGFPAGIQLYFFDSIFNAQKIKAYCLAYDSKITSFEFKPVLSATAKTPSQFFAEETGITLACINGGYFGGNQSFSLVKYTNTVTSPNIKSVTRTFNGNNTAYYPTRGAFGVSSTGTPSVAWVYNVGAGNDLIYSYPSPSPNAVNSAPQPQPTETFPAGGAVWNTTAAIGGSPVLIKNNNIQITDAEELISINNTTSRPRSAIGYLSNGIVLILAVEGDNAPNYPGINLADLASLLKTLGCTEALNLDGGGSTSLVVNNTKTVRPGDNGVERPVVSAVLIKRK
ncbi:MAG TPA: phosphodiester glycosidase family protein, partial [Lacibacter sp.]|nr:phosphodiester glycosidase family protein [Lacibacter sp.]